MLNYKYFLMMSLSVLFSFSFCRNQESDSQHAPLSDLAPSSERRPLVATQARILPPQQPQPLTAEIIGRVHCDALGTSYCGCPRAARLQGLMAGMGLIKCVKIATKMELEAGPFVNGLSPQIKGDFARALDKTLQRHGIPKDAYLRYMQGLHDELSKRKLSTKAINYWNNVRIRVQQQGNRIGAAKGRIADPQSLFLKVASESLQKLPSDERTIIAEFMIMHGFPCQHQDMLVRASKAILDPQRQWEEILLPLAKASVEARMKPLLDIQAGLDECGRQIEVAQAAIDKQHEEQGPINYSLDALSGMVTGKVDRMQEWKKRADHDPSLGLAYYVAALIDLMTGTIEDLEGLGDPNCFKRSMALGNLLLSFIPSGGAKSSVINGRLKVQFSAKTSLDVSLKRYIIGTQRVYKLGSKWVMVSERLNQIAARATWKFAARMEMEVKLSLDKKALLEKILEEIPGDSTSNWIQKVVENSSSNEKLPVHAAVDKQGIQLTLPINQRYSVIARIADPSEEICIGMNPSLLQIVDLVENPS